MTGLESGGEMSNDIPLNTHTHFFFFRLSLLLYIMSPSIASSSSSSSHSHSQVGGATGWKNIVSWGSTMNQINQITDIANLLLALIYSRCTFQGNKSKVIKREKTTTITQLDIGSTSQRIFNWSEPH